MENTLYIKVTYEKLGAYPINVHAPTHTCMYYCELSFYMCYK